MPKADVTLAPPFSAANRDGPDAGILALYASLPGLRAAVRNARETIATIEEGPAREAARGDWQKIERGSKAAMVTLFEAPAKTPAGLAAKLDDYMKFADAIIGKDISNLGHKTSLVWCAHHVIRDVQALFFDPENGPDAELIRVCAEFEAAEKDVLAVYEGPGEIDEDKAMQALVTIQEQRMVPLLDRMEALQAQTAAGIHARARAVAASNPNFEHSFEEEGSVPERLLRYLMRDSMALAQS